MMAAAARSDVSGPSDRPVLLPFKNYFVIIICVHVCAPGYLYRGNFPKLILLSTFMWVPGTKVSHQRVL